MFILEEEQEEWIRQVGNNVLIELNVKPNAKTSKINGVEDGMLKVDIDTPPVEGKANTDVVKFMATSLSVKKCDVSIVRGMTSHHKTIQISNATKENIKKAVNN